jgi:hypothetical protein
MKQMIAVTEKGIKLIEKSQAIEVGCSISLEVPGGCASYTASVGSQSMTYLTTVDVQNRLHRLAIFSILLLHSSSVHQPVFLLPFSQPPLIAEQPVSH